MKIMKRLVQPVFLVVLMFGVTACVMLPAGGPHGHSGGGGVAAPHR